MKKVVLSLALAQVIWLQGCALDTFKPKPDDPNFAPALPEEEYTQAVPTGGIYNAYTLNNGIYSDTSAHKVGDIISVYISGIDKDKLIYKSYKQALNNKKIFKAFYSTRQSKKI